MHTAVMYLHILFIKFETSYYVSSKFYVATIDNLLCPIPLCSILMYSIPLASCQVNFILQQ